MTVGVIEHYKIDQNMAAEAGFDYIESKEQFLELPEIDAESLANSFCKVKDMPVPYIVVTTCGECNANMFTDVIDKYGDMIKESGIPLLIENGMRGSDESDYRYNDFSEISKIAEIVKYGNDRLGAELFGICLNIGNTNLLAQNIGLMIEKSGDMLALVHVNDNDGFHNDKQMPYTYTNGWGERTTTDWKHIIGALIKIKFDGLMVFDVEGLFERTPDMIIGQMLTMLAWIAQYWLMIIFFEELLASGKKIILFGAGRMASNYLHIWGEKYKPEFIVDSSEQRWGSIHRGIPVKNPDAIYEIPADERLVLICNGNYEGTGLQLRKMGVEYYKYDDNYYDFILQ